MDSKGSVGNGILTAEYTKIQVLRSDTEEVVAEITNNEVIPANGYFMKLTPNHDYEAGMKCFLAVSQNGKRHIIVASDINQATKIAYGSGKTLKDIYQLKENTFDSPGFLISDM